MKSTVTAIVLAAGSGKRMNSSVAKQFLLLEDKPVLYYSLKAFEESMVDEIILVTSIESLEYVQTEIIDKYGFQKIKQVIEGGKERYDSVKNAMDRIVDTEYVLVHDGARPFITWEMIQTLVERVKRDKACLFGVPVKETIKVVDENQRIKDTPSRTTLWVAQTPQAFEFQKIKAAYDMLYAMDYEEREKITDDAMVYEMFIQEPVVMVMGNYTNIKLTTPEDLDQGKLIMKRREKNN